MLQLFAGSFLPGRAAVRTHVTQREGKFPLWCTPHRPVLAALPSAPGEAHERAARAERTDRGAELPEPRLVGRNTPCARTG